jgi:hypothetical protein
MVIGIIPQSYKIKDLCRCLLRIVYRYKLPNVIHIAEERCRDFVSFFATVLGVFLELKGRKHFPINVAF